MFRFQEKRFCYSVQPAYNRSKMTRSRVSMKDVAAAAGVSLTTVSDALNDRGRLPEATRRRVRDVAEQLGFQPHRTARSLAKGRSGILMLSVSLPESTPGSAVDIEFFVQLMSAASGAALHRGWALVLAPATGSERSVPVDFDGAIVVDPRPHDALLRLADAEGKPVVTVGRDLENPDRLHVDNDHSAAVREALDLMAKAGAERPALLTSEADSSYVQDCIDGYNVWCTTRAMTPQVVTAAGGLTQGAGYEAARDFLTGPKRPDAVFTTLDSLALGVHLAAQSLGLDMPHDLQVATLSDSEAARQARPPVTAVDLNPVATGKEAVQLLIKAIEDAADTESFLVPTRMHVRGSTGTASPEAVSD
ncbi:LacI family DNA-binding transcriptional regulator [Streptomyces sp. 110]|uniref:LacI family DNA-binding transcriptional regulator n=1 Tax=Streptomyces endocoffeicus TaxID=2898945 RepID=A0ABS1Q5D1_9ACTN|nr:LacI family DNA-binding transcriptional regulator [Streptomyces endocoffeicus]MBL1119774.1 LacI family DNA-binding transcriptional regulator [Streptomyces endocoffeicus]